MALQLQCMACGGIIDGEHRGHAAVNTAAALARSVQIDSWRRAHPGEDAARHGPQPVPWRLVHLACDELGERTHVIPAYRLRTARRVLQQTWRLWSKSWAAATDWPHFARGLLANAGEVDGQAASAGGAAAKRAAQQALSGGGDG
ncbi:hypothetical protein MHIP_38680 [Mycolicibacterium hippocampi]|uniref:Uncharacterized protein n=1 Tax=Mycolicibacterium hippocampi TaxID=659824 RepID=A0A7I9ZQX1_9MYCO|nr:hypothetical protein MHIP_38680 [Mycolicibacterium hippocampi]